jgi:molybdopterin/thiamine biosynthesis adenylyltransferase
LGVGGLGSDILINLLRMGVKKIFMLDYDSVDDHNLNRQNMYCMEDVGKRKISAAVENSKFHNIANTEIVTMDDDALKNW